MKFLLVLAIFSLSVVHATTVNLNIGESVTIQSNSSPTTVSCGGENLRCNQAVRTLKAKFVYCKEDISNTEEDCINQIWPNYKVDNNQCINEGFDTCFKFCKDAFPRLDCLTLCR